MRIGRTCVPSTQRPTSCALSLACRGRPPIKHVHITTRCRPRFRGADDQAQVPAAIRDAILNRAVFELEQRVIRVDGKPVARAVDETRITAGGAANPLEA
jgi:hypothetical protein